MPYQVQVIDPLLGLNEDQNPHTLKPGELTIARNAVRRFSNLVGTRPGCVALSAGEDYVNALTGAPNIQGAVEYRKDFDASRALVAIADKPGAGVFPNSKIWIGSNSRLSDAVQPAITAGQDQIWTFALHNNLLWAAGGAATDDVWTWDGDSTTPSTPVIQTLTDKVSATRLRPQYIKEWRGYVLINGLRGGTSDSNNPAISRYQTFAGDPTDDKQWLDGNTLGFGTKQVGIDTFGGSFSTGFGQYYDNRGDFLLVLSNNQIASFIRDPTGNFDFFRNDIIANGCVHQRAFVDLGPDAGDAVYMSRIGIHSIRSSQQHGNLESAFLSRKIQKTFSSLNPNRLQFTCAAYDRGNARILFAMSTGASTKHNIIMALDVRDPLSLNSRDAIWYGPWQISPNLSINHMQYARSAAGNFFVYAFTTNGLVLRFDENIFHDGTSSGYQLDIRTRDEAYGQIMTKKRIGDTMVHITQVAPGASQIVQVTTELDYGARVVGPLQMHLPHNTASNLPLQLPFQLGATYISNDVKLYTQGSGRTIAQRFMLNGADQPFFLGRIEREIDGMGEDTGATTQ